VIAAGGLCAAIASLLIPRPPPPAQPPTARLEATLGAAVARALDDLAAPAAAARAAGLTSSSGAPIVLGVGELHQTSDTAAIPSSLARFTRDVWPLIAARVSDLIVETWVTDGACGRAETSTVEKVETATERPAATGSEIVTLLERAKQAGARPHILTVSCADYRLLAPAPARAAKAPLDFQRMLALIEAKLEAQVTAVLAARPAADAAKLVVVYGGALHNDLYPDPLLAPFSYGVPIFRATLGRYRELDLYVPEYLERNPALRREPWFSAWRAAARPGQLVLIRRSAASFILVFAAS
jgi:hypothetical protein